MMSKQEEFLWIVQTVMLANNLNLIMDEEEKEEFATELSGSYAFIIADEAVRASKRIPDNMSVRTAASEFLSFTLKNWRNIEEKAHSKRMECPHWFLRFGAEPDDLC